MIALQEQIYRRLLSRDPGGMDLLMQEFFTPVYRLASLITGRAGRPEDVEEIAADAFAQAWDQIAEYDPNRTTLLNWVLMITKYIALDYRRKLIRRQSTPDGRSKLLPLDAGPEPVTPESPEGEAIRKEQAERLHQALDRLPEPARQLLVRRYFFGASITEIAEEEGLPRAVIDNRLTRARHALKAVLSGEEEGHEVV